MSYIENKVMDMFELHNYECDISLFICKVEVGHVKCIYKIESVKMRKFLISKLISLES